MKVLNKLYYERMDIEGHKRRLSIQSGLLMSSSRHRAHLACPIKPTRFVASNWDNEAVRAQLRLRLITNVLSCVALNVVQFDASVLNAILN